MESLSRTDQLTQVKLALKRTFPKATFSTNDDANPATPMTVRAEWGNGRIKKIVRADSSTSTVEDFLRKATAILKPFEAEAVPNRHLQ